MTFRMTCPKCGTTSFNIERDNRSYAPKGQTFELIFSCRCGKQLFGDQVVKEHDRQKKAFESNLEAHLRAETDRDARRQQEEDRKAALREAYAHRRRFLEDRRKEEAAMAERARAEEDRRWRERVSQSSDGDEDDEGDSDVCGWHPCNNPPRSNSKYCSRDCSNKNARWRYKRRKGKGGDREAA